ncbi:MAG TPA: hypothetical protein VKP65_10005 [Rhodothermales bacterium]|nr:hypothetical protein [Rhodothermales bacterium]
MNETSPDAATRKARPAGNVLADGVSAVKDRVVISLLFRGRIAPAQVQRVVAASGVGPEGVLWRRLAEEPDLDREEIFSEAARVYAFEEADISHVATIAFIRSNLDRFSEAQWEQMRALGVLPVAKTTSDRTDQARWTFAAYDPLNPEVNDLLETLGPVSYRLVYLCESEVKALIEAASPRRNEYLEQLQDETYAFDLDTGVASDPIDEQEIEAQIRHSALLTLFEAMLMEAVRQGGWRASSW